MALDDGGVRVSLDAEPLPRPIPGARVTTPLGLPLVHPQRPPVGGSDRLCPLRRRDRPLGSGWRCPLRPVVSASAGIASDRAPTMPRPARSPCPSPPTTSSARDPDHTSGASGRRSSPGSGWPPQIQPERPRTQMRSGGDWCARCHKRRKQNVRNACAAPTLCVRYEHGSSAPLTWTHRPSRASGADHERRSRPPHLRQQALRRRRP